MPNERIQKEIQETPTNPGFETVGKIPLSVTLGITCVVAPFYVNLILAAKYDIFNEPAKSARFLTYAKLSFLMVVLVAGVTSFVIFIQMITEQTERERAGSTRAPDQQTNEQVCGI
ncbi:hypothetical protein N0V90_011272 [Kalmusia sp. IMI 367209]|nr:hypothetical protein N0V90_011272 [Kalmusia sp. IMI 367209]